MQDNPDWRSAHRNVYSTDFKLRMVDLAQLPSANIAAIAREHSFNHNILFKWLRLWQSEGCAPPLRKTYNKPPAPTLLPVQITLHKTGSANC
ncbi:transposase [Pectobacterium versatile]|uniref:transposase n=1 Tax=Pectobacterium versatile TaxID=2488639 RepID=UPI001F1E1FFA|nr:transposase [Pectobacterium versatile]